MFVILSQLFYHIICKKGTLKFVWEFPADLFFYTTIQKFRVSKIIFMF